MRSLTHMVMQLNECAKKQTNTKCNTKKQRNMFQKQRKTTKKIIMSKKQRNMSTKTERHDKKRKNI